MVKQYLIVNLGISPNFGKIDFEHLTFPTKMRIDYIRVYQPRNAINIGCDPDDYPTEAYINAYASSFLYRSLCVLIAWPRFPEAYSNPNLTTWVDDFKQPFPKNRLIDPC